LGQDLFGDARWQVACDFGQFFIGGKRCLRFGGMVESAAATAAEFEITRVFKLAVRTGSTQLAAASTAKPEAGRIVESAVGAFHEEPSTLFSAHPETASFGPWRRTRSFSILEIAQAYVLFLRLKTFSILARNQNLPFLDGHYLRFLDSWDR